MYANKDLQEYEEYNKRRESPLVYFFKKTSPEVFISIIGLFILAIWFVYNSKVNPYVILGIIAAIIIFIVYQMNKKKEEEIIPLSAARMIAVSAVERSIGYVYSLGTRVWPGPYAKLLREGYYGQDYKYQCWFIGVKIVGANSLRKEVRVAVNCYTGLVESISPAYSGFDALSIRDKDIIIPTNEFQIQSPNKKV